LTSLVCLSFLSTVQRSGLQLGVSKVQSCSAQHSDVKCPTVSVPNFGVRGLIVLVLSASMFSVHEHFAIFRLLKAPSSQCSTFSMFHLLNVQASQKFLLNVPNANKCHSWYRSATDCVTGHDSGDGRHFPTVDGIPDTRKPIPWYQITGAME